MTSESYHSPHCWGLTMEIEAQMRSLWFEPITGEDMARRLGISAVTLIKYGRVLGLPSRQEVRKARNRIVAPPRRLGRPTGTANTRFSLSAAYVYGLRIEAEKRNIPVETLCQKLLSVIAGDKLVDAILDDA